MGDGDRGPDVRVMKASALLELGQPRKISAAVGDRSDGVHYGGGRFVDQCGCMVAGKKVVPKLR